MLDILQIKQPENIKSSDYTTIHCFFNNVFPKKFLENNSEILLKVAFNTIAPNEYKADILIPLYSQKIVLLALHLT
jgi:hypothetical protein